MVDVEYQDKIFTNAHKIAYHKIVLQSSQILGNNRKPFCAIILRMKKHMYINEIDSVASIPPGEKKKEKTRFCLISVAL